MTYTVRFPIDVNDLNSFRRDGYQDEAKNYDTKNSNSLVDDKLRVYKGGSWSDVAYWLSPGTRRYMDQDSATAMVGFRCAMIATGSSQRVRINNISKTAALPGSGFFCFNAGQCDGENVKRLQPVAFRNVSAHSSSVAPVVSTSSMMMTLSPRIPLT
jgi:hypothetical protein